MFEKVPQRRIKLCTQFFEYGGRLTPTSRIEFSTKTETEQLVKLGPSGFVFRVFTWPLVDKQGLEENKLSLPKKIYSFNTPTKGNLITKNPHSAMTDR